MTDSSTHLVRTKNGRMVHKRGCSYASWGKPWIWAEGKGHSEIVLSALGLGVNFCKRCEPLVGLPADQDDDRPLRGGVCPQHGEFNNFSGRCLHPACAHQPGYEGMDDDFVVVRCLCRSFYRICETQEVAEAEYRNHVQLAGGAA